jgi:hypothetical protein
MAGKGTSPLSFTAASRHCRCLQTLPLPLDLANHHIPGPPTTSSPSTCHNQLPFNPHCLGFLLLVPPYLHVGIHACTPPYLPAYLVRTFDYTPPCLPVRLHTFAHPYLHAYT